MHADRRWWPAIVRNTRRLVVAGMYVGALFVAFQLAEPLIDRAPASAPDPVEAASAASEPALPERPDSLPARIPSWAWEMYAWHDDRLGNERPLEAPERLPAWYWEWREWRLALAKSGSSSR